MKTLISLRTLGFRNNVYPMLDGGEGDRGPLLSWCPGTYLVPLENELGGRENRGSDLKGGAGI
jgi:hypothetical protein